MSKRLCISRFVALSAYLFLTSCTPLVWNKPGATNADFNSDKYTCQHDSFAAAPNVAINTNCNTWTGQCQVQDFNQRNRNDLFNSCMNAKGWSLIKQQRN